MTRVILVPFLAVVCTVLCARTMLDFAQKKAIIRRLGQCKGTGGLPILFHDVVIAPHGRTGDMTVSLKVSVRKEISNKFSIVLSFWRCDASGNPGSCEYILKDYNATDICTLMSAKDEIWTVFIDHFDMPANCPIKVGQYAMTKTPITTDFMKYMPVSDALWKVRLTGWDAGSYVACVELEEQIIASYKRKYARTGRH